MSAYEISQKLVKSASFATVILLAIAACRGRTPLPNETACPSIYMPVCGVIDQKTYANSCEATKAGQTRTVEGECREVSISAHGSAGQP